MDDFDIKDWIFSPKKMDIEDRIQLCAINIGKVFKENAENKRKERAEIRLKMLEEKMQETVRKYNSLTVKEKAAVDLIDNEQEWPTPYLNIVDLWSTPLVDLIDIDNEQGWPTHTDPAYLKETQSLWTTPGYKFQPNDEEVIWHLKNKRFNPCQTPSWSPIKDCTDLYGAEPGHLPDANSIKEKEALYYYVPTKKKSGNGDRIGPDGYWRATGNKNILSKTGSEIGHRRTLKYFEYPDDENQKSSKYGKSTNWMMHEYRLATTTGSQSHEESLEHWTICKVTWTGKNIKVTNDFSGEGSIGPLENKYKNELKMHIQNEGDLKISNTVDSKQEQIAQTFLHFIGDEFGRWTQEIRGKLREQRMNREIHQSEEVTPCHASGMNSTLMATTHEVETKGLEPRQFENPGKITEEIGTYISEQTSESWFDRLLNSDFIGREDENQSRIDPSISEQTSASWGDCFLNTDVTAVQMKIKS